MMEMLANTKRSFIMLLGPAIRMLSVPERLKVVLWTHGYYPKSCELCSGKHIIVVVSISKQVHMNS